MKVLTVRQANGGTRFLAVSDTDAAAVRRDRTQLDCVTVLGAADRDANGVLEWAPTGPRDIPPPVRGALTLHAVLNWEGGNE